MRKLKQILFILTISATLSSCSVTLGRGSHNALMEVNKGMTKEEVNKLFGQPDFRRFDSDLEQWEYQRGRIGSFTKYLIIEFENDTVRSMDSFNEISKGTAVGNMDTKKVSLHVTSSIDDDEFDEIYHKVKDSVFKESTLDRSIRFQKFSCAQCIRLMSLYTFDDDKLKMLKVLKGHIADTQNYNDIIDSLDFISSRDKAREILGTSK